MNYYVKTEIKELGLAEGDELTLVEDTNTYMCRTVSTDSNEFYSNTTENNVELSKFFVENSPELFQPEYVEFNIPQYLSNELEVIEALQPVAEQPVISEVSMRSINELIEKLKEVREAIEYIESDSLLTSVTLREGYTRLLDTLLTEQSTLEWVLNLKDNE